MWSYLLRRLIETPYRRVRLLIILAFSLWLGISIWLMSIRNSAESVRRTWLTYDALVSNCGNRSLSYLALDSRPERCNQLVQTAVRLASCEILGNLDRGDSSRKQEKRKKPKRSCVPRLRKIGCYKLILSPTSLPCAKDFVFEELKYAQQHRCLMDVSQNVSTGERSRKVPPIAHFFWYEKAGTQLSLRAYLSIISFLHFSQPNVLYIWNNGQLPGGKWWYELLNQFNQPPHFIEYLVAQRHTADGKHIPKRRVYTFNLKLVSVRRALPTRLYSRKLSEREALATVRQEALLQHGGVTIDSSTLALRPLHSLLHRSVTYISNTTVFAEPGASQLFIAHEAIVKAKQVNMCSSYDLLEPGNPESSERMLQSTANMTSRWTVALNAWVGDRPSRELNSEQELLNWHSAVGIIMRNLYFGRCEPSCV